MSAPQLDILALEPFFGGSRRAMLETLVRCSRHRWTVLKLPPRRIERRLSVAANWFGEQLARHWVGKVDLLFTSELMNLANLFQLLPALADKPAVVYFHENQLPEVGTSTDSPLDLVNLNTASAATEIWFNSEWHRRTFIARVKALLERHPELSAVHPLPRLKKKASVMAPPVDLSWISEALRSRPLRDGTALFVETRDGEIGLLNKALGILRDRKEKLRLITLGPLEGLGNHDDGIVRQPVPEHDELAQAKALCESGVYLSVKPDAASDFGVVRGLAAGCRPVLPDSGFYPELLPPVLQRTCLYEMSPGNLADHLQSALSPFQPSGRMEEVRKALAPFDPAMSCRQFDERFEELVWVREVD